jgi:hypothetical protein
MKKTNKPGQQNGNSMNNEKRSEEDKFKIEHVEEKLTGESETWLRNFCATNDCPSYEYVMEAVTSEENSGRRYGDEDYGWTKDGEYLHFNGSDAHGEIPQEFWDHVEKVTGKRIRTRPAYFSCSC